MRIPLDYYRILGLPVQASHEQLQQAYRDRTVQLPRREYSNAAIGARKQLIAEAYVVLVDSEQRIRYDASYLAQTYDRLNAEESFDLLPGAVDPHTPSIEIRNDQFVGALLILQELGEYELVLQLGRPYLSSSSVNSDTESISELGNVHSDIVLTVALACLELGREQWQQGQYENAATSLKTGQEILLREGLFASVEAEIQTDIYKLRPYRIIELLAQPEENVAERHQGLQLLDELLQERGGIDGNGDDGSGLGLDGFLRFIQQLRSYLTAKEQQRLFEAEGQRPSPVATYLAVYTLLARGFAERMPMLISRAKLLLMRLSKRQDLYLEQAICSLLLGQTEEASHALELSQENEPLTFIREHSQGSPDLLPGLCLYGERWLQTEVFPHFRDLAQQQASLKDYFANEQVQAYLEALPIEAQATIRFSKSVAYEPTTESHRDPVVSQSHHQMRKQRVREKPRRDQTPAYNTAVVSQEASSPISTAPMIPFSERIGASDNQTKLVKSGQPRRARRRTRKSVGRMGSLQSDKSLTPRHGRNSTLAWGNFFDVKGRLVLLVVAGVVSIVVVGWLLSWCRQIFFPATSLPEQQQSKVQQLRGVKQSSLPIVSSRTPVASVLTQEMAKEVIQSWLSTKAAALGSTHAIDRLKQILVEPALSKWQLLAQNDKADNRYHQYKHSLKINSVHPTKANPDKAQVEAIVNEVAQVYENGQLNQADSSNDNLRVRYDLVRKDGQWRIQDMTVVR